MGWLSAIRLSPGLGFGLRSAHHAMVFSSLSACSRLSCHIRMCHDSLLVVLQMQICSVCNFRCLQAYKHSAIIKQAGSAVRAVWYPQSKLGSKACSRLSQGPCAEAKLTLMSMSWARIPRMSTCCSTAHWSTLRANCTNSQVTLGQQSHARSWHNVCKT